MCCTLTYLLTLAPLHVGQGHGMLALSTFSLFIVPGAGDGAKLQHYACKGMDAPDDLARAPRHS